MKKERAAMTIIAKNPPISKPARCQCVQCVALEADPCAAAELEDDGPADTWPAWTDGDVWGLGPGPEAPYHPAEDPPHMSLAEFVDAQQAHYESFGTDAAALVAKALAELACKIRWIQAETVDDFLAREDEVERDARTTWFNAGYDAGRQASPCTCFAPID
jgi:hypothetical protein